VEWAACIGRGSGIRSRPFGGLGSGAGRCFSGGGSSSGFGRLARLAFLFFAKAARLGQFGLLHADGFGLGAGFFLAALQVGFLGRRACGHLRPGRRVVALDEDALLAHLDLDRARLTAGIGLLDLGRRLLRQRDLLALGAGGAVRGTQELQQALLVGLGQRVVERLLGDAGRMQLLQQGRGRAVELESELGDGGHGHVAVFLGVFSKRSGLRR